MKHIANHLGEVLLALAAIVLCIAIISFTAPGLTGALGMFNDTLTGKGEDMLNSISTPNAGGVGSGSSGSGGAGSEEKPDDSTEPEKNEYGFYFNRVYVSEREIDDYGNIYNVAIVFYEDECLLCFFDNYDGCDGLPEDVSDFLTDSDPVPVTYSHLLATDSAGWLYKFSDDGESFVLDTGGSMESFDGVKFIAQGVEHGVYFGETYVSEEGDTVVFYPDRTIVFSDQSPTLGERTLEYWSGRGHYSEEYFVRVYVSTDGTFVYAGDRYETLKTFYLDTSSKLKTPKISITNDTLNITPVAGAEAYEIYREDTLLTTTSALSVDLSEYISENNTYILVRAVADGCSSSEMALARYGIELVPGLYKSGAVAVYTSEGSAAVEDMLLKSWGELVITRYITVSDNIATDYNDTLSGDLICPQNGLGIGSDIFNNCVLLTGIILPNSTTTIGDYSFENCTNLTNIVIPNGVTSIGNSAFYACSKLVSVIIPNSVTSIGKSAFSTTPIQSITLPDNVTHIGDNAFRNCKNLTSITIPDSVTYLGAKAFSGCSALEHVTLGNNVAEINYETFYGCDSLKTINIPDSVTFIGESAFSGCGQLENVTFGSGVTSIYASAFQYCSSFTSITIPSNITYIGKQAFNNCDNLSSITFEITEGWRSTTVDNGSGGYSINVSDPAANATNIQTTNVHYIWTRR